MLWHPFITSLLLHCFMPLFLDARCLRPLDRAIVGPAGEALAASGALPGAGLYWVREGRMGIVLLFCKVLGAVTLALPSPLGALLLLCTVCCCRSRLLGELCVTGSVPEAAEPPALLHPSAAAAQLVIARTTKHPALSTRSLPPGSRQ
jgi:hypothetical protein